MQLRRDNGMSARCTSILTADNHWNVIASKHMLTDVLSVQGNTASQLQIEFEPKDIIEDSIYYSVLLTSEADVTVTVTVGGVSTVGSSWRNKPAGGVGIFHGSVPMNGRTGEVSITVRRGGTQIATLPGPFITTDCQEGIANYDAWAGGVLYKAENSVTTPALSQQVCIEGTGAPGFTELCAFNCRYGYCPEGACVCTAMGLARKRPDSRAGNFYPAQGLGSNYIGLCNFACEFGNCLKDWCGTVEYALVEPTVSPFLPPSCRTGTGSGVFEALCSYTCRHGFCPRALCTCTAQGALDFVPPTHTPQADKLVVDGHGLCAYGCARGTCPDACIRGLDPNGGETATNGSATGVSHLDQDCFRMNDCVDLDNPQASSCGDGYVRVGTDVDNCDDVSTNASRRKLECTVGLTIDWTV